MSLETWKQAYYPVPVYEVDKSDAVAQSLRKWEGLRSENLGAHEMEVFDIGIRDELGNGLHVTASTCALCACYYDDDRADDDRAEPGEHSCGTCPLYLARGNKSCCEQRADEKRNPFQQWTVWNNPEPMIHWLKKAQAWEDANDPKPTVTVRVHEGPKPEARITADEAIALGEAIHQYVLNTSHEPCSIEDVHSFLGLFGDTLPDPQPAKPAAKPPLGGLHHEGPALPPPREGD